MFRIFNKDVKKMLKDEKFEVQRLIWEVKGVQSECKMLLKVLKKAHRHPEKAPPNIDPWIKERLKTILIGLHHADEDTKKILIEEIQKQKFPPEKKG
jgi:hypothetical protein